MSKIFKTLISVIAATVCGIIAGSLGAPAWWSFSFSVIILGFDYVGKCIKDNKTITTTVSK